MHDVYAYGVIAPSTLIEIADDYPPPGGYAEISGVHPSIGGEAAGGAYVLARLGVPTKLAGNRLGDDDASTRVLDLLSRAGVDCGAIRTDASPVTEFVVAGGPDRTVFGTYGQLAVERTWTDPSRDDVRSSRIVCLDPFFGDASRQVAEWCVEADVPYVSVDVAADSEIARHADALVVSEDFVAATSPGTDPHDVLNGYTSSCRGLVVVTRGGERLLAGRSGEAPREFRAFPVDVRDTTGAGDSFRAGIIYGILRGYTDDAVIRHASAVAALVCQRVPGVVHSPTERELVEFLLDTTTS